MASASFFPAADEGGAGLGLRGGAGLTLGGPYVEARVNLDLGEVGLLGVKFWLMREVGVTLTDPATSDGRV